MTNEEILKILNYMDTLLSTEYVGPIERRLMELDSAVSKLRYHFGNLLKTPKKDEEIFVSASPSSPRPTFVDVPMFVGLSPKQHEQVVALIKTHLSKLIRLDAI